MSDRKSRESQRVEYLALMVGKLAYVVGARAEGCITDAELAVLAEEVEAEIAEEFGIGRLVFPVIGVPQK